MSEHLVRAAKTRHEDTLKRATDALRDLSQIGETVTFATVAGRARISADFLTSPFHGDGEVGGGKAAVDG